MLPNYEKITQSLNFFIRKNSNSRINKLKAIKLLWAADRYHMRKYGRMVSLDRYCAMQFGPVGSAAEDIADLDDFYLGSDIIDLARQYIGVDQKNHTITSHKEVDFGDFSKTDLEALEFAWQVFGSFDGFTIAKISHDYPEWAKFKGEIEAGLSKKEDINPADFFENPTRLTMLPNDPFELDSDILESSKVAFVS